MLVVYTKGQVSYSYIFFEVDMEDFKILNKSKFLFRYIEENICNNIPKIYSNYRNGLMDNVVNLNYYIIKANINEGNIRNKYQKEVLVCIGMIDLYLGILVDINVISKKRFMSSIRMLDEIRRMTIGWIGNEKGK